MLKLLAVLGLIALGFLLFRGSGGARIDGAQARQLVAHGALLLDVRTPAEFAAGHLEGAVNMPVGSLSARLSELDPARPVVVYCRSGARSAGAASQLRAAGLEVSDLGAMGRY